MNVPLSPPSAGVRSTNLAGIGLMLTGILLFSVNDVMGKWLVATYAVGQVLLLQRRRPPRPGAGALAAGPAEAARPAGTPCLRVAFSTLEVACFYWAVAFMPLADVMTYYLAGPIYVATMAVLWLGERLDGRRIAAILVGFVGVLIALRPSAATLTLPALIALAGSVFFALLMITTRKLRETSDTTLVLGQILGALLFGIVAAPFAWVPPSPRDFALLSLLGVVAMLAHVCVNRSLKLAPASVVSPYQYTLLVWAVLFGYLVFGDVIHPATLAGAVVICAAGLALLVFERDAARRGRPISHLRSSRRPEALHHGADLPGHELGVAVAEFLRLRALAGGDPQQLGKDLAALFVDRDAVEDVAAVDVHVVDHAAVDVGIRGELHRGCGLRSEGRAAACREGNEIGAAGHLAGRGDGIVAGRVHVDEAAIRTGSAYS